MCVCVGGIMGESCVQASKQFKRGQNLQNTVDLRANYL